MNTIDVLAIHHTLCRKHQDENKDDFYFYLLRALPLLDEYRIHRQQQDKLEFVCSSSSSSLQKKNDPEEKKTNMDQIVNHYMSIVQEYFPHEFEKNWETSATMETQSKTSSMATIMLMKNRCSLCKTEGESTISDNHFVCEKCGLVSSTAHNNSGMSYKDIDRVNMSSKYTYDRRTHFRDCINQFQGKQNSTIDPKVYADLEKEFVSHGLIPKEYKDLPREEAFRQITKEHVLLFLKETGHTKHYEDVTLIFSQLTGKPAPDISHMENQLMRDFDQLTELYDKKYKTSERKNFINTQYVLYQLLRRHKYPCRREDFNILKTIDRKYYHDTICAELFMLLGWNFQALF